jgi:glycosyltransferase involved in cell wall biosynthesis
MRILLATESYYPNIDGGANARRNLAIRLKERSHDVAVVAPGYTSKNYIETIDDITIFRLSGRTLPIYTDYKFCFFPLLSVGRVFDEFKPDVVDINSPYQIGMSALACAKKRDIPAIGTLHVQPENMLMAVDRMKFLFGILEKIAWSYIINFFNRCDYVTSPTPTAIGMLRDHGLTADARPISSGINLDLFKPGIDTGDLRTRFSIPDKPIVLYTGRISGEKRLDVLIKAIPKILETMDVHFVICGSGREVANLKSMVRKMNLSDNITFTGFIPESEFPSIYGLADVFVMPSESELQSIVTMEALASGLPVIAADKDALPELVRNPENGFLFPPGDSQVLSEMILEVLTDTDLKQRMGEESLRLIQEHSMDNTLSKYENLYREAIDNFNSRKTH